MNDPASFAPPSPALPRGDSSHAGGLRAWLRGLVGPFMALCYLRYHMRRNAWQRDSIIGRVVTLVFLVMAFIGVGIAGVLGAITGFVFHVKLDAEWHMVYWTVICGIFMLMWTIHFSSELFRNDALTLDRFMHLPLALSHAFALNYLNSLINFPIVYFLFFTSGAIVGSAFVLGPGTLLLLIPLLLYLFFITSLTSQFQGAIAAWIANPRRRQLAMMGFSLFFIVVMPLLAIGLPRSQRTSPPAPQTDPIETQGEPTDPMGVTANNSAPNREGNLQGIENREQADSTQADSQQANREPAEIERRDSERAVTDPVTGDVAATSRKPISRKSNDDADRWAPSLAIAQWLLPPLWLAGCASAMSAGNFLGVAGLSLLMLVLSVGSMRRGFATTVRYYQHGFGKEVVKTTARATVIPNRSSSTRLIERRIPGIDETTSAIVMQTWIAMWRAPELKLMLLAPIIQPFLGLFLIRMWSHFEGEAIKTCVTLGIAGFGLYTSSGVFGNQFGLDRGGFRMWVLSPIERWAILHGRNVAYGILAWTAGLILILAVGIYWKLPFDKIVFVALALLAYMPFYLLVSNLMAILSPFGLAPGALQPKTFSWKHIAINLLLSTLHPALLFWAMLPLFIEWGCRAWLPSTLGWPIAAAMEVPWCVLSFLAYRWILPYMGQILEAWELKILPTVTAPVDG